MLSNLDLTANKGSIGSAVFVGPAVSAILQFVLVSNNTAQQGAIFADDSSSITIIDSVLSRNAGSPGNCAMVGCLHGDMRPGSNGSLSSALVVGPGGTAKLENTHIASNTADFGVVFAGHRSSLTIANCTVLNNTGPAIISAGSGVDVSYTVFMGNKVHVPMPTMSKVVFRGGGGAVQLLCLLRTPGGCDTVVSIKDSKFKNNSGTVGGALYCGWRSTVQLWRVDFVGNTALEGGAVYADSDSCLESMVNTTFALNSAQER